MLNDTSALIESSILDLLSGTETMKALSKGSLSTVLNQMTMDVKKYHRDIENKLYASKMTFKLAYKACE